MRSCKERPDTDVSIQRHPSAVHKRVRAKRVIRRRPGAEQEGAGDLRSEIQEAKQEPEQEREQVLEARIRGCAVRGSTERWLLGLRPVPDSGVGSRVWRPIPGAEPVDPHPPAHPRTLDGIQSTRCMGNLFTLVCASVSLGRKGTGSPRGRPRPVHIDCVCNSAASSARMWRVLPGSQPLTVLCADTVHSFTLLSSHIPALSMSTCSRSDRTTAYCVCTCVPTLLRSARSVLYSLTRTLASCQSLQTHTQTNKQTDRQTLIVACCCGPGWRASERASSAISIRRCFPTSCSLSATFPAGAAGQLQAAPNASWVHNTSIVRNSLRWGGSERGGVCPGGIHGRRRVETVRLGRVGCGGHPQTRARTHSHSTATSKPTPDNNTASRDRPTVTLKA